MAFALIKFHAEGVELTGAVRARLQRAVFHITATAADVALDLGNDAGTFWTAAIANATYGQLATNASAFLQVLDDNVAGLLRVNSPQLIDRIQTAAAGGNGEYAVAIQNQRPNITVNAADGETAWLVECVWQLSDNIAPMFATYG